MRIYNFKTLIVPPIASLIKIFSRDFQTFKKSPFELPKKKILDPRFFPPPWKWKKIAVKISSLLYFRPFTLQLPRKAEKSHLSR